MLKRGGSHQQDLMHTTADINGVSLDLKRHQGQLLRCSLKRACAAHSFIAVKEAMLAIGRSPLLKAIISFGPMTT